MKGNKGITLIALVVTIIVLLILAGVAIAMLTGNNSILNRAKDSVAENELAEGKDAVSLAWNAAYADYLADYYKDNEAVHTFSYYLEQKLSTEAGNSNKFDIYLYDTEHLNALNTDDCDVSSYNIGRIIVVSASDNSKTFQTDITDQSVAGSQGNKATLSAPSFSAWTNGPDMTSGSN